MSNIEKKGNNLPEKKSKDIIDVVMNSIANQQNEGLIDLPKNYSLSNAFKSARLILSETLDRDKRPVLESCSKVSIANALLDMAIRGLNPSKSQCYFIPYKGKLQFHNSYFGALTIAKRDCDVKSVVVQIVRKGDEYETETDAKTGLRRLKTFNTSFENKSNDIIGTYCYVHFADGSFLFDDFTIEEIKTAWLQRPGGQLTDTHKKFESSMCKKTTINKMLKDVIKSSVDYTSNISIDSDTEDTDYEEIIQDANEVFEDEPKDEPKEEKEPVKDNNNPKPLFE